MKRLVFLLLLALVLSGCGAAIPSTDWCYRYDFGSSNYSASVNSGIYTNGIGFSPDTTTGLMDFTITNGSDVTPEQVIFQVRRGDTNQVPIDVLVDIYAFGLFSGQRHTIVPAATTSADLSLFPGNGDGTGSTLYIYGRSSRTIFLTGVVVLGNGSNPFPENNCGAIGDPTPTPVQLVIPEQEMSQGLDNANADLESVDVPLTSPNGLPLLPAETGQVIFSYAKWITSPVAAQELMGPFAPVYYHVGYLLGADVALLSVYIVVYGAVYVIRWVIWLYRSIVQIVSTLGSLTIPGIILLLIIFGVLFLGWLIQAVFGGGS